MDTLSIMGVGVVIYQGINVVVNVVNSVITVVFSVVISVDIYS